MLGGDECLDHSREPTNQRRLVHLIVVSAVAFKSALGFARSSSLTVLVNEIHQPFHVVHRRLRQDPMTKIEDVSRATINLVE